MAYGIGENRPEQISAENGTDTGTPIALPPSSSVGHTGQILRQGERLAENARVLIVEDDTVVRKNLTYTVTRAGYEAVGVRDGRQAVDALGAANYDVVITSIALPDMDGIQLLEHLKATTPDTKVIITGFASIETAVETMRRGAFHYFTKPLPLDELPIVIAKALEKRRLKLEVSDLRQNDAPTLIGHSPLIRNLQREMAQIATADCTVLILGETGTGKEVVARSLHAASLRGKQRFLAINCASLTENLLANELFGHEKAAFSGAIETQRGLLETANKGTFFLDEVGDMPIAMQTKLLRVLETRTILRVGGTAEIPIDVRIIAATNHDLKAMVEAGSFRRDLYYRLNIITLQMPLLMERHEDIALLTNYFIDLFATRMGKKITGIDDSAMKALAEYDFPGNVRELKHIIERAVVLCNGNTIYLAHLPEKIAASRQLSHLREDHTFCHDTIVSLDENEKRYLAWVLKQVGGAKGRAAELLNLNRGSLWRKLKHFELDE